MTKALLVFFLLALCSCDRGLSLAEEKHYQTNQAKAKEAVSTWIRNNAIHPGSYEPLAFSDYSESFTTVSYGQKETGSETYKIKHTHYILGKDSVQSHFSGYFILLSDFSVNVIEQNDTNSLGGEFPPQTQIWSSRFGNVLSKKDSLYYAKKQKEVTRNLITELEQGLESGNLHTEDPKDATILKNLLQQVQKKP
ncbi:hypothetical protein [Hymenobacter arizonensis]|uniref:DUF4468 domain-containing protein n=1 Tax=Hymenobacter arizonensis TaxID=1227077 RepID=A0A1I5V0X9_HYMAR|nr:hypothetical protein [Hymenobacter arizonensis]SFQ01062.1 hypothetical protein SAMN04515668_1147 [Hymenobacter arizonensis]